MADFHVFIDTNIWLSFYSYSKDDIEQLKKIVALIKSGSLKLYINDQLRDEFYRNREQKLRESTQDFSRQSIPKGLPRYMSDYAEAAEYKQTLAAYEKLRDALVTRAKEEAQAKSLDADRLFADILIVSMPVTVDARFISKAIDRRLRGNPPGKPSTLGDQIHWEFLLDVVPSGIDLHIVSKDGDFESPLRPGTINQFLEDEWLAKKKGSIKLHSELRPFLNSIFPDIKLAVDVEKNNAIRRLVNSGSFASTHAAIENLSMFVDDISWNEADRILTAGLSNSQISWIGADSDVSEFYVRLFDKFEDKIEEERLVDLKAVFYKIDEAPIADEDVEPPF